MPTIKKEQKINFDKKRKSLNYAPTHTATHRQIRPRNRFSTAPITRPCEMKDSDYDTTDQKSSKVHAPQGKKIQVKESYRQKG